MRHTPPAASLAALGLTGAALLAGGCQIPNENGARPANIAAGQLIGGESGQTGSASSDVLAPTPSPSAAVGLGATTPPAVNSASTQSAAAMQEAFRQVARTAEPAVVTITTLKRIPVPRGNGRGGPGFPFGGPGGPGGGQGFPFGLPRGGGAPLPEGGGGGGGDFGFGFGPGSYEGATLPGGFRRTQGGGGASGPLVGSGIGSGFLVRPDGLIITNAHVVRDADTVTVKLADGREFRDAKVLGQDVRTDIAVVKIPATNLPTLALADSERVSVGDWAIAVGNPFGLEHTLTVGVISAKARQVPLSEDGPGEYLQTDASINPGNSGGPLLDIYGRVIGVNNAIYSRSGGNVGIGFAIPIATAREIADTLAREGRVRRARLGVAITDVGDQAAAFGLPSGTRGALIEGVDPDGPAARAGLQAGDVVTALDGQPITESGQLQERVTGSPIGSTVRLSVLRGGQTRTLSARLEELKDAAAARPTPAPQAARGDADLSPRLGIALAPVTPEIAGRLGLRGSGAARGAVIAEVQPGSAAQVAGLRPGDVVQRVGQTPINGPADVRPAVERILNAQTGDQRSVALFVVRGGQGQYVVIGL